VCDQKFNDLKPTYIVTVKNKTFENDEYFWSYDWMVYTKKALIQKWSIEIIMFTKH
jgi:hypothetical protein